nr:MOSC domain-containing protein [Domibacillus epiphyticus]
MTTATIASLWRYPVKSMMGEEINACDLTEKGLLGDRAYGIIDQSTGKLANAKNPLKWPDMFQYRAAFTEPPESSKPMPPVRITFPDGENLLSTDADQNDKLTKSFGRKVQLGTPSSQDIQFKGYIPEDIKELENPGTIFTRNSPQDTFFDIAMVHIITTSTIDALRKLIPESRIEPRRFRPNIMIHVPDAEGFIENGWVGKVLTIGGGVQLKILQPTPRCVMTTLAQGDLPKDPNVLKSIVKNNAGSFGVYASVVKTGEIRTGDSIHLQ